MKTSSSLVAVLFSIFVFQVSQADLVNGVISDFQDGTIQGWSGGTVNVIPNSGPSGTGDFSLQLQNGGAGNFAMFNQGVFGSISPTVTHITADILRPAGEVNGFIRLVLFNNDGARWTSSTPATVIGNSQWNRYVFSIRETDLTRVLGNSSYASLTSNLSRIMFRHDPGTASAGGASLAGSMNFDNITAIPEPATGLLWITGFVSIAVQRRRRRV
jgi:hypothetical protein